MKSSDIRKKFFDFFIQRGHTQVGSSPLIPAQDPTLLFTNAGMNQFKDVFLGKVTRSYKRAVSIQKCVRAGGKHNDLDNVGFTRRHLTFFEMMGNFSFGDYFKKEAIQFAWDFLTKEIKLPQDKLYASVFKNDNEAYDLWHTMIGLPKERIYRLGAEDNFWQMGDTGPCGPCSEIYMDLGERFGCGSKTCAPGCTCDRFFEIWNLVFMQFDRQSDGKDNPLQQTGVDTGMGLERLALAIQHVDSVFETDLFTPIIRKIEYLTDINYTKLNPKGKAAFHVLADHTRSAAMIISDGGVPSHEGRGYVLRKIIRRAALFSQKLSDKNIIPELIEPLSKVFGTIYPELVDQKEKIKSIISDEIGKFSQNLIRGKIILKDFFKNNKTYIITGKQAFTLYDTYGFPLELTRIIAEEKGFNVDTPEFKKEMEQQRVRSGKKDKNTQEIVKLNGIKTEFNGYEQLSTTSKIQTILQNNTNVSELKSGQQGYLIPEQSPFFVEGGGQVADQGTVVANKKSMNVQGLKLFDGAIGILVEATETIRVGDTLEQNVNKEKRSNAMKNHTATHLLQAALIEVLGKNVKQAGSFVHPDYLRFDFTYHKQLTPEEIQRVEDIVNQKIMENITVRTEWTTYDNAIKQGVIAFFGEKYNPENVRIVDIPNFSAELCGGTHVQSTGDIGTFKITEAVSLSAGNRRIVALSGPQAFKLFQETHNTIKQLSHIFKVPAHDLMDTITKQQEQAKKASLQSKKLKQQALEDKVPTWIQQTETINEIPTLLLKLQNYDIDALRSLIKKLQNLKNGFYFIASITNGKTLFIASLHPSISTKLDISALKTILATSLDLRGGGSSTILQGGGPILPEDWRTPISTWLKG